MMVFAVLVVASLPWAALGTAAHRQAPAAQPVRCEFRVFDGSGEVTRETRVRIYANGSKENGRPTDAAGRISLLPGLYDAQIIRERDGQVKAIRWIEHLLVVRYPDEENGHLEVANFKPQYGALELATARPDEYEATAFPAGDRAHAAAKAVRGDGYLLLVVPAGKYDVRLAPARGNAPETWLTDVDVPADRTRLRSIGPARQDQE